MIDWVSLIIVAVISVGATALFAVLLSTAIRLLSIARTTPEGESNTSATVGGWILLCLIGVMILLALYLIIPQFH